jgi:predicted DCC family thiol-disulfide oxidoreductase YuxK
VPHQVKSYSPYQFALFRIVFGIYLAIHFGMLIPYGTELYSNDGMLPDPRLNPTYGIFPNVLTIAGSPAGVRTVLVVLTLLSMAYAVGYKRRIAALVLWYGWACIFNRNLLTSNPSLPFVGWLLLASAIIPAGEPLRADRRRPEASVWRMPPVLFYGAWIILAVGYTVSGIHKLTAPSWRDGSALIHVLSIPLARDTGLREMMLALPEPLLHIAAWGAVALEALFLPLCLWPRTRMLAWLGAAGMHVGILTVVNFTDLTAGMLMIHLFTLDARWLRPRVAPREQSIVFFDGICGLCNRSVNFLMEEDRSAVLKFAPLQGMTARDELSLTGSTYRSVIFKRGSHTYFRSSAVIQILSGIGGIWRLAEILTLIPAPVRDAAYDFVARHRYKWFGTLETCRMPRPEDAGRMLP